MAATATLATVPYIPALDGVRGVAVLAVMAFHVGMPSLRGGFFGVDVFFVLSGFLITALILAEKQQTGSIGLGQFYARRALRLFPALFVQLAIIVAVPGLFMPSHIDPAKLALIVMVYAANWVSAYQLVYLHVLQPTWSLAIEEQFYLLWPPLLALLLRLKVPRIGVAGLVGLGIVTAQTLRIVLWEPTRAGWARVYFGLDTRMDGLLLGCLVGLLAGWKLFPVGKAWRLMMRVAVPASAVLVGALLVLARDASPKMIYGGSLAGSVAVAVLLAALVTEPPRYLTAILELRPLVWIGRMSYGLYLWHFPVFHGLLGEARGAAALGLSGVPLTVIRFAAAFAAANLSYILIERPALRLKEAYRPVTAPAAPAARAPVTPA